MKKTLTTLAITTFFLLGGCSKMESPISAINEQQPKSAESMAAEENSSVGGNEDLLRRISSSASTGAKTYRNDQYGFELEYPHDWLILESQNGVRFDTGGLDSNEYIKVTKAEGKATEDALSKFNKEFVSDIGPFELGGEKGTVFTVSEYGVQHHVLIEHDGYLYHFTTGSSTQEGFFKNFRFTQRIAPSPSSFAPRYEGNPDTMFYDPR